MHDCAARRLGGRRVARCTGDLEAGEWRAPTAAYVWLMGSRVGLAYLVTLGSAARAGELGDELVSTVEAIAPKKP